MGDLPRSSHGRAYIAMSLGVAPVAQRALKQPSEPPEPYGPRGSDLLAVGPPDPLSWQHVFRQASRLL